MSTPEKTTMFEEKISNQAVRLLNSFHGVMNIIEYKGGEAVTLAGVNWDIYIKDMSLTADPSLSKR